MGMGFHYHCATTKKLLPDDMVSFNEDALVFECTCHNRIIQEER